MILVHCTGLFKYMHKCTQHSTFEISFATHTTCITREVIFCLSHFTFRQNAEFFPVFLISQCLPVSTSLQITLQQFLFVKQEEQKDMFHLLYRHLYAVVRVAWRGAKHLTFSLSPSQQHQVSLSSFIIFSDFSLPENIACFLFLVLRKSQQNLFMTRAFRVSIEAYRDPLRYVRLPTAVAKSVVPTTEPDLDSKHHQAQVQEGKKGAKRNNCRCAHRATFHPFYHLFFFVERFLTTLTRLCSIS